MFALMHGENRAFVACIALLTAVWNFSPTARAETGPSKRVFDVAPRKIELVQPGAVLENGPPTGWSHLIIQSKPKVTQGDLDKAGKLDIDLASAFFTVMAANVKDGGPDATRRFALEKVGVGVGATIQGKDTVISPDTQAKLGANLGFIARMVLKSFYSEQMEVKIVAASDEMMVVDSPVVIRMKDHNELNIIRHALILDRATGRLERACWLLLLGEKQKPRGMAGKVEWLRENHLEKAELFLDKREYRLGMATKQAYGLITPPLGASSTEVAEAQLGCLCAKPFSEEKAEELASLLRKSPRVARKED